MQFNFKDFAYSPAWNLFLITSGALLFALGSKAIVLHHQFITGGIFGISLLAFYQTQWLSAGIWYFLLNVPLFILGWVLVSRRFLLYSLYAMLVTTVGYELIDLHIHIENQLYAAIAGGVICGTGSGVILRSLGSGGGLDIIAVILYQKYNLGIGRFFFLFNLVLFAYSLFQMNTDLVIASMILVFISSTMVDYTLSIFSQRKVVYIISEKYQDIAQVILKDLKRGATIIKAEGAYSGKERNMLMTITNNVQLKRLEEVVFTIDADAMFIVENTFNVIGSAFGKRKLY
jgi:uncharacterized membrane-anchored protein YitT (DUF2179 family)